MKLTVSQLRRLVTETADDLSQAKRRGKAKLGSPSMWDKIPEDMDGYGVSANDEQVMLADLKEQLRTAVKVLVQKFGPETAREVVEDIIAETPHAAR